MSTAPATRATLNPFEGLPVRQVGVEIPAASGGLRESMKIDPQEFHQGDVVFVVLECPVNKVRFEPIDKDDPRGDQRRVHVFGVEAATIVDAELVEQALAQHKDRVAALQHAEAKAKEAEAGITRLYDDKPDGSPARPMGDELQAAHDAGDHAGGLVEGCPDCDAEADAVEAEAD